MSVSYGVEYDGIISGCREDLEKIPAIVRKISDDKQVWWDSMTPTEHSHFCGTLTAWYKDDTEEIATSAEKALEDGDPLAFAFWVEEDDSSHGIMEDIMTTLDEALPGLTIIMDANVDSEYFSTFISPPGQSSLKLSESDLFDERDDWEAGPFQNCLELTYLYLYSDPIRESAFKGCVNLTDAVLPAVQEIAETAFEDCKNLTIHAPAGSYAEKYAQRNSIPFQVLEE